MTINLFCNSESTDSTVGFKNIEIDTKDVCAPVITASHSKACPVFSVTTFSRFFLDNPLILGLSSIAFGLVVAFFGRKFFPITIFATGAIAGFGITMLLFSMLSMISSLGDKEAELSFLGTLFSFLFSVCMGLFLGFILQRMLDIGAAIMGAIGGVFLAFTLNQLLFFWIDGSASKVILWTLSLGFAGYFAYLSKREYDTIVIFGTAMLGAYCTIRGFSFFFPGSFPNETEIIDQISKDLIPGTFYAYVFVFIGLCAAGFMYQRRQSQIESALNIMKMH